MKTINYFSLTRILSALALAALTWPGGAATLYVSLQSTNAVSPYDDWSRAATNIQDAVDFAAAGDEVVVTNGLYQRGGGVVYGTFPARVAVTKPLTVRSVNGPGVTFIQGIPGIGDPAVRCAYLTNGAFLTGFTLTNGGTQVTADASHGSGGAVWAESTSAVVSNCVITSSSAYWSGGGAAFATLLNCVVSGNGASGVFGCLLTNCVVTRNSGVGGGARECTLDHCTVSGNYSSSAGGGALYCTLISSDITNNQSTYSGGGGNSSTFWNCYLANNHSGTGGGGASDSTLNNCRLVQNSADWGGGGCSFSTVTNCFLALNSAPEGGASWYGMLVNCTLTTNSAGTGGGSSRDALRNCIVYYNTATSGSNYANGDLAYCCTVPLPATGSGNLTNEPLLSDFFHLSASSPCRGAGDVTCAGGADLDGEPWANPPSIGCDEFYSTPATNALVVVLHAPCTNLTAGFVASFTAQIFGYPTDFRWEFGDGTMVSNQLSVSHSWAILGNYPLVLRAYNSSNPGGISQTATIQVATQAVHYVSLSGGIPARPYQSWATAARTIQDAVDAASVAGALVLVSNGVYRTGGAVVQGALTNRVAISKPLIIQSVNGPAVTVIEGFKEPGTVTGDSAVRCAYLTDQAVLSGFTLTNGSTRAAASYTPDLEAGGAFCESARSMLTNCVLVANQAWREGGAVEGGTVNNSVLKGNTVAPGDSDGSMGGGAVGSTLNQCLIISNSCSYGAGGLECTFNNCVFTGNQANTGGGAAQCTLNNCTVVGNFAASIGGGVYSCGVTNSILYDNSGPSDPNASYSTLAYCCTTPLPSDGPGNIDNPPLFIDPANGNWRLQSASPCINSGLNAAAPGTPDYDGLPRISGGTVDMGAYEYQGTGSLLPYAWLQQYGLPTDGSADHADADSDGMDNSQEWVAGTDPTNAVSLLRIVPLVVIPPGLLLRWNSDASRAYFIERATGLGSPTAFSQLQTNVSGQAGTTTFTDTTAPGIGAAFYRVGTGSGNVSTPLSLEVPQFMPANVTVTWTSVTNRSYSVERSASQSAPMLFAPVATNVPGQAGMTSVTDTNASGAGPFFYRVRVQ